MKKYILALSLFLSTSALAQNYQATQGAGTTFGTKLVTGVNYPQFVMCDPTTPANCAVVDASGIVTVKGTVAATQSGTWTVQPGNTANTTAWLVTGTGGTFPATQSGTWTVQPGNTANTTPWLASVSQGGNTAIVKAGNTFVGTEQALGVAVTNTLAAVTPGDGITTTVYGTAPASPVIGVPLLWNGTTYDRQKSVATGIAAVGGTGTAGTAATNVLTVQGIASMTPFLSNPGTAANWGIAATAAAVPANAVYTGFNSGGNLTGVATATPLPVRQSDGTNLVALDPCQTEAPTYANINISAAGAIKIITGVSAKKIYFCSIHMVTNAANNIAIVEGTGTNCGTGKTAVLGGTTASTGWNFSANGGIALGNGASSVIASTTNADDICLDPSASTQLTGMVKWVSR